MADFVNMNTEEELVTKGNQIISTMQDGNVNVWTSFVPDTAEGKAQLFNAMSESGEALMDYNGQQISIRDVVIQPVRIKNEDESEDVVPRVVIIDVEGKVYGCSSWGMYRAVTNINAVYGTLHFDDGLKVEVRSVKAKRGKTLTLKVI